MCRLTYLGAFALVVSMLMGCAICCGPYDDDYGVFGGQFQRVDPAHGRVGSILSDPAYQGGGPSADSNLAPETPLRSQETIDDEGKDGDGDLENDSDEDIRRQMEELRKELQLDGNGNESELPGPGTTPQPDLGDDRETSRGWQNRLRGQNRQWR